LRDFDLSYESNQSAIRDVGGLETLDNLLETESVKCKIGALILHQVSQNVRIRAAIAEMDGMRKCLEKKHDNCDSTYICVTLGLSAGCTNGINKHHFLSSALGMTGHFLSC
jgi:hypothetical protein